MKTYSRPLDPAIIKDLSGLKPARFALAFIGDWVVIGVAIALGTYFDNLFVYLAAVLVIAGRMHALGVLVHDFAHYRFVSSKRLNDWVGNIVCAWPIGATVESYRSNHLPHHQHTNTELDPDWAAKVDNPKFHFPQSGGRILRLIGGYCIALESALDLNSILRRVNNKGVESRAQKWGRLAFYVGVALVLTWTGTWLGFLLYWLVPYLTAFMFFLHVRSVAEHFAGMDYDIELGSTRTVLPQFWERWFFCPHNVNYHIEHHIYPSVPFFNLPVLHSHLLTDPEYQGHAHLTRGYSTGLLRECLA